MVNTPSSYRRKADKSHLLLRILLWIVLILICCLIASIIIGIIKTALSLILIMGGICLVLILLAMTGYYKLRQRIRYFDEKSNDK